MATSVQHAKVYSKIQSGLPAAMKNKNLQFLNDVFDCKISEATKHCVEGAVRDFVIRKVCTGGEVDLEKIRTVAEISVEGARNELCLVPLPILVLSDTFDCITISQCEELFSFVEENVAVFKESLFFTPCKNQVLRMCNDVLRRLSRSQNTIFCGRILLFLARFFPFSERSGLNLISEFNLENTTMFKDEEMMEVEEENGKKLDDKLSLDYTLYTKFWSIQDFFRNPVQCHQKAPWKLLTKYVDDILEAFSSFKLQANQTDSPRSSEEMMEEVESLVKHDEKYFPKYLTSQKLLNLQFSDSNFRRYILVQLLILGQYLTTNIKFKQEQLSNDQYLWVRKMAERTYLLLSETPPNGNIFVEIVKHVLKREDMWNNWKNSGCPEVKKPGSSMLKRPSPNGDATDDVPIERKRRKLGDLIRVADEECKFVMGNDEMTRLWNLYPNNLEACKTKERDFVPSLEKYFLTAIEQIMREGVAKEGDKLVNNSNFGWGGLRLLARRSPHFFTHSTQSIATLPDYLKSMIKKLAKDLNLQFEEVKQEDDDDVKVIIDQNETNKEENNEEEEPSEDREETNPISDEERKELASLLAKEGDEWKSLGKKLGFETDEFDYFLSESKSVEEAILLMLERWVDDDKDEATGESISYTLGGLKLAHVAQKVFPNVELKKEG